MPFSKGETGNPSGRKKGVPNRQLMTIRGKGDDIVLQVIAQAENGCLPSQKMVMDRIVAPLKSVELPLIVTGYPKKGTVLDKANFFVDAVAAGKIPPSAGASIIQSLSSICRIKELVDFEERLIEVERRFEEESK